MLKKEVERVYLNRAIPFITAFPEGEIKSFEKPDFLLHSAEAVIGIELTELDRQVPERSNPQRASEAMRRRVVERAQALYAETGLPPVRATVLMYEDTLIKKSDVEELASVVCNLVVQNLPAPNSFREDVAPTTDSNYGPGVLHSITVYRADFIIDMDFNCPGTTWVSELGREDIERTLRSKETLYSTYRKSCDKVWLLINVDIEAMSTWFEFNAEVLNVPFSTSFERVFVFGHFGNRLIELKLERNVNSTAGQ